MSRRTVRYYVQIGLLPPPEGAGRGHYYLLTHVDLLARIRDLRAEGRSLERIRGVLAEGPGSVATPEAEPLTRVRLADGLELLVSHRDGSPTPRQLRALACAAAAVLERS